MYTWVNCNFLTAFSSTNNTIAMLEPPDEKLKSISRIRNGEHQCVVYKDFTGTVYYVKVNGNPSALSLAYILCFRIVSLDS